MQIPGRPDVRSPRFKLPGFPPTLPAARAELHPQGHGAKPQIIVVGFSSPKVYSAITPETKVQHDSEKIKLSPSKQEGLQFNAVTLQQDLEEGRVSRTPQLSSSHNSLPVGSSSLSHLVVRSMSDRGDGNMSSHRAQVIATSRPVNDRVSEAGGQGQLLPCSKKLPQPEMISSKLLELDERVCSTPGIRVYNPQPTPMCKPLLDLLPAIRIVKRRGRETHG
jgi:hypothetical protein